MHEAATRSGGRVAEGPNSIFVEVRDARCLAWSALTDEYGHLLAQAAGRPPGHGPEYFGDGGCRPEGGWAVCLAVRLLRDACDDRGDRVE